MRLRKNPVLLDMPAEFVTDQDAQGDLARHGRYVTFYITHTAVAAWKRFRAHFEQLHWKPLPDR